MDFFLHHSYPKNILPNLWISFLIGGLEHDFDFAIFFHLVGECHDPNFPTDSYFYVFLRGVGIEPTRKDGGVVLMEIMEQLDPLGR